MNTSNEFICTESHKKSIIHVVNWRGRHFLHFTGGKCGAPIISYLLPPLRRIAVASAPLVPNITSSQPYTAMPAEEGASPHAIDPVGFHQGAPNADSLVISVPDETTWSASRGGASVPLIKSGIFGTSSNLVNSIVGAGIIGIPYAFKQSGLVAGVFLLILVAYMTGK